MQLGIMRPNYFNKNMVRHIPLTMGKTWLGPEHNLVDQDSFF
jgi:hypothetical protein